MCVTNYTQVHDLCGTPPAATEGVPSRRSEKTCNTKPHVLFMSHMFPTTNQMSPTMSRVFRMLFDNESTCGFLSASRCPSSFHLTCTKPHHKTQRHEQEKRRIGYHYILLFDYSFGCRATAIPLRISSAETGRQVYLRRLTGRTHERKLDKRDNKTWGKEENTQWVNWHGRRATNRYRSR